MKPTEPSDKAFRFSPRQERIFTRLRLIGPGLAAFYRDACRLASLDPPLDSVTHLIGHLFREVDRSIVAFLLDASDRESLRDIEDAHKKRIRAVLKKLGVEKAEEFSDAWAKSSSFDGRAHRRGVRSPRQVDEEWQKMLDTYEAILDDVLHLYESQYAQYHERIENLLKEEKPTKEVITTFGSAVPNNAAALTYFFGKVSNEGWLEPLSKAGYFEGPTEPETDPETGYRMYLRWPPGRYLIRMASEKPHEVMNILLGVNDRLNPYVQQDLIEAATKMPPKEGARLVPKLKNWLQMRRDRSLMSDCADLVVHLASGGCTEEATDLVRELLSVTPFADDSSASSHGMAWDYDYIIKKTLPTLIDVAGLQALRLFCDLLDQALNLAVGNQDEVKGRDYSNIWRTRIELTPDRERYEFQNAFVTGVRDASVRLIQNGPTALLSVIEELEGRSWLAFHRIALHVFCEFAQAALDPIIIRLKQVSRYDHPHFHNEYYRLARVTSPLLPSSEREALFDAIQAGPDVEEVRSWLKGRGQEVTDATVQSEMRKVVRNRLGELRNVLNELETSFLHELENELGPAVPLATPLRSQVLFRSSEPEEAREFESMGVDQIVSFLQSWGPSDDEQRHSPDKVCRSLLQATAANPEKFAKEALRFQCVDPIYLRHVVQGFRAALDAKEPRYFTWDNVIGLCNWVVSQGREIPGRAVKTFYWDPDWGYTKRAIAALVDSGLRMSQGGIPFPLREQVWAVLEPLTRDPEPTPEYERQMIGERHDSVPLAGGGHFLDSHMGPADVAINAVRCLAITAAVSYGMWIKRNLLPVGSADHDADPDFEAMPELRDVLNFHLDSQKDASVAVAYVFGKEIRSFYGLDAKWADKNKARIFSKTEGRLNHGAAAWEGYLLNNYVHPDGFDILKEHYEQAVEELGRPASETGHFIDLDLRLGKHLLQFHFSSKIDLGADQGILERFFRKAGDEVVGQFLLHIGWDLFRNERVSGQRLEKLVELWDWRMSRIAADGDLFAHEKELRAFGTWFGSGKFDDAWALKRLREVLEMNGQVESDEQVFNRLAGLVNQCPEEVLECATLLARGVKRDGRLSYWRDHLHGIISATQNAKDSLVQQKCNALESVLLSKGLSVSD